MRIQGRWFLRAVAGLWLLGGVSLFTSALDEPPQLSTTTPAAFDENVPTVQPIAEESPNGKAEPKTDYAKDQETKAPATESKKKALIDFKTKAEQKYKSSAKDDGPVRINEPETSDTNTPMSSSIMMMAKTHNSAEESSTIAPTPFPVDAFPILFHGEPVVATVTRIPGDKGVDATASTSAGRSAEKTPTTAESTAGRARALNVSAPEPTNSLHANLTDLSDVSMDENDKEVEGGEYVASPHNATASMNTTTTLLPNVSGCFEGNRSYSVGETVVKDCEEKCVCSEGGSVTDCQPLCLTPYVRAGRGIQDPLCQEKQLAEEPCCALLVCSDSAPEPDETCAVGNQTVARGQRVEDGCEKICICEAGGVLKCHPRCPPNETATANQHDRCVELPDPSDSCCMITLCDVTLGDHEIRPENAAELTVNRSDVKVLNSTAIKLKLSTKNPQDLMIEISENNHIWRQLKPDKDGIISRLEPARSYYVRVTENGRVGPAIQVSLPAEVVKATIPEKNSDKPSDKNSCSYRGKMYKIGAEWYDECISYCTCAGNNKTECVTIECPTDFGLDVLDPHCIDWETVPPNFVPEAPHCCPEEVRCRDNGSCAHEGKVYDNWSTLPGPTCGSTCHCNMGKIYCEDSCPPVPAAAYNLPCPQHEAVLDYLPGDTCCKHWVCRDHSSPHPGTSNTITAVSPAAPLATDTPKNASRNQPDSVLSSEQEPQHDVRPPAVTAISSEANSTPSSTVTTRLPSEPVHYPMDPGRPTVAYNGPYSPNYEPTPPTIENVFHLSSSTPEKPVVSPQSPSKDKIKPKADAKKPVESLKPHKDGAQDTHFPGPLSPDKIFNKPRPPRPLGTPGPNVLEPTVPNELPTSYVHSGPAERPQFIPLTPHSDTHNVPPPGYTPFMPSNGQNIPMGNFGIRYEDPQAGPTYDAVPPGKIDASDPNVIVSSVSPKKKASVDLPLGARPKQPPQSPRQPVDHRDVVPEELYRLINMQHPGLIGLDHGPPQTHPGLYELHRQITGQNQPAGNRIPPTGYSNPSSPNTNSGKPGAKKSAAQVFVQKDENGGTTYHIHAPDVLPSSPQQIEELLAHVGQPDPNPGPFQRYPGQAGIPHILANGPPRSQPQANLPLHITGDHLPHLGITHANHPFAAQTPNQSGLDHNVHIPPGLQIPNGFPLQGSPDEVTVQILEPLDEKTVRLVFTVPQVLVGLHGRVELRYTSDKSNVDPSTWKSQVFAPPHDLIATPQLEFELSDLKPATEYKVKITVKLNDLANSPTSKIYSVRTLDKSPEVTTLPPQIPIDAELKVMEKNSTWVKVMWKKFTEYELQFIDGVQLRYKEHDGKVYAATPLIHRAVTNYVIEDLKPSTVYEIGIYFIPFPGQATELISEKTIQVDTSVEPDPYAFDVKVEIKGIKSTEVEVSWSGVPYPEDKYVNIYRAIYQSDSGKEDTSTFKIAKRDSPAKTIIGDLKPGTRYRLWIEVYLTNGRIKKSNVQDFVTKPGVLLSSNLSEQTGKLASIPLHEGDYYGPLVVVAIVASLAILSTLILLMMLMKRRTSSKADISPRKTTSAYDNPSYKTCEDAVTITNGRNKTTEHEMATINSNSKETASHLWHRTVW